MRDGNSFSGKYAIVTGGTQGLGEATARLLAERGAAGIIICGRNAERGQAVVDDLIAGGCTAHFVKLDLAKSDECRKPVAKAVEQFGTVHILINSAALTVRGSIWDTSPELWDNMMAVNVRAPFLLMQDALKVMYRDKIAGSIVNVASVAAHGGPPFLIPYSTSKAALVTLTRNVAYAVMRHRIRVNAINLGWMDTPGEDVIQRKYHSDGQDWLEEAEATQPFGRLVKTDEAARAIAFLASGESGLLTGSVMEYDQSVIGAGDAPKPRLGEWGTEGISYE
jgi:NAD(P)-dependent dehydrogenase (short-subunit alcohol dehydrogenase family)